MAIRLTELAWAAGFIDGEGCIFAKVYDRPYWKVYARLTAVNVDSRPIQKLLRLFGGSVNTVPERGVHRKQYIWSIYDSRAAVALTKMLPYLVNKRKQATAFIRLSKIRSQWRKRKSAREPYRKEVQIMLATKITDLKRRIA